MAVDFGLKDQERFLTPFVLSERVSAKAKK